MNRAWSSHCRPFCCDPRSVFLSINRAPPSFGAAGSAKAAPPTIHKCGRLRRGEIYGPANKFQRLIRGIEYDPEPPFPGGTPRTSEPDIVRQYLAQSQARFERRSAKVRQAALNAPGGPAAADSAA